MGSKLFCAVVVTFYPDTKIQARIQRLLSQFCKVIVVDNGSTGIGFIKYLSDANKNDQIDVIINRTNLGIATALNQGVAYAVKEGFAWIALLDQDSSLNKSAVGEIKRAIDHYPATDQLMIVACKIIPETNVATAEKGFGNHALWQEAEQVITSGSFLSANAFQKIGGFNEQLFVDYVDIEYCLRLNHFGYKAITAHNAQLYHMVGNQDERELFGKKIHPTNHSPLRRYYQFRNAFLLNRTYFRRNPQWVYQNFVILMKILIGVVLFESNKFNKLLHIAKGIYHGVLGCAGKRGEEKYIDYLPSVNV